MMIIFLIIGNNKDGPKNILVLSTFRSGSKFAADLLNHYPNTYYSFEPIYSLHSHGVRHSYY